MQKRICFILLIILFLAKVLAIGEQPTSYGDLQQAEFSSQAQTPLTLEAAFHRVIERSPQLEWIDLQEAAANGEIEQAGLLPNPELETEIENFFGSGPFRDTESLEITVGVSQLIELGNKRQLREAVVRKDKETLNWNRVVILAKLHNQVQQAYSVALLEQENVFLQGRLLKLAEDSAQAVERRVIAARASNVELSRAQLAIEQHRFALRQAARKLEQAKIKLAALWGDPKDTAFSISRQIWIEHKIPSWSELVDALKRTPYLARFEAERAAREAELDLEKANGVQDVTVFGGVRYLRDKKEETAFVAGVSVPLPFFDRNQGNIRAARVQVRAVETERLSTERELLIALSKAYQELSQATEEAAGLQETLLPAAEKTLAETEEGYQLGKFTLLAVLESRTTLFEIRQQYLEALGRYMKAKSQIDRLTQPAESYRTFNE